MEFLQASYANLDAIPRFFLTLITVPLFGLGILKCIHWLLLGEVELWQGLLAMGALMGYWVFFLIVPSDTVAIAMIGIAITLFALMPYAQGQLARADFHAIDVQKLERAYQAIYERPEAVPAYFQLAEALYNLGLDGHAIVIAEQTLNGLSQNLDPLKNRSPRDLYKEEEYRMNQWKRRYTDPKRGHPIKCKCGYMNPVGTLSCQRCQAPYLVEQFRGKNLKAQFTGRLLVSWVLIGAALLVAVIALLQFGGPVGFVGFLAALALAGLVIWLLFRTEIRSYDNVVDI